MKSRLIWRCQAVTVTVLVLQVVSLPAQRTSATWRLEGSRGSFCIWYLTPPQLAEAVAGKGVVLTPASRARDLNPALRVIVQDEPRFGDWIPAAFCLGMYDRLAVDGRVTGTGSEFRPIAFATSSFESTDGDGVKGSDQRLVRILSDDKAVRRAAGDAGIEVDAMRVLTKGRGETDPTISITTDEALISWSGHASGPTSVGTTRTLSFGYVGDHHFSWGMTVLATPEQSRNMVGALEIAGRGALAKALKASPIRVVGPVEDGGAVVVTLQRYVAVPK